MCGLFGWQLKPKALNRRHRQFMVAMLAWDMDMRGGHSWGIYRPESDAITKGLGTIVRTVFETDLSESRCFIAHTRFATTGSVTIENSHPFRIGGIVGAHNGTVGNHAELNRRYRRNCTVDSMHLFHHLAERKSLWEIEAYGTIQYVHQDQRDRIHLATFDGELCVAQGDFGVIWASTPETISDALEVVRIDDWDEMLIDDRRLYFVENGELHGSRTFLEIAPYVGQTWAKDRLLTGGRAKNSRDWPMSKCYDANGWPIDDMPSTPNNDAMDEW